MVSEITFSIAYGYYLRLINVIRSIGVTNFIAAAVNDCLDFIVTGGIRHISPIENNVQLIIRV